jgi:HEPN domain-containing protein
MASTALKEMHDYGLRHAPAAKLINVATEDYAAARCLALNLLMHSLVMGAQAAEKYLKGHLLLVDPKRNVRSINHSLTKLLVEVDMMSPLVGLGRFGALLERFERHYRIRYPDDHGCSTAMTTADIGELDQLIVLLNENLPCPHNYKYRTGLYAAITFSLGYSKTVTPKEHWIKQRNLALIPLLPRIASDYVQVMEALHPKDGNTQSD